MTCQRSRPIDLHGSPASRTGRGTSAPIDFARAYIRRGWPVFPLEPRSKVPLGRLAPHGVHSATLGATTVEAWFRAAPAANIAIACGAASGFFVIDVDPRNGGDDSLGELEGLHGMLPRTVRALAGGGGMHLLFAMPTDAALVGSLGPGLDVKSTGGYIVAPPSIHPDSGAPYRWDVGALPTETAITTAPSWLLARLSRPTAPFARSPVGRASESFLAAAFASMGWLGHDLPSGAVTARCPWLDRHSDGRGDGRDSSTVLLPPTSVARVGAFKCSHAHCAARRRDDVVRALPRAAIAAGRRAYPTAFREVVYALARTAFAHRGTP